MGGAVEFGLNAAMVVLLGATIFYCWLLSRRIQVLQDSKGELADLLSKFDRSTKRATHAMELLQHASKEAGKNVQSRIEKAQYVLDDLNYVMDRADKIASQMEAGIAIARQREKIELTPKAAPQVSEAATLQAVKPKPKPVATPVPEVRKTRSLVLEAFDESRLAEDDDQADVISDVTKDSILASLRQAKAGGKQGASAMSSLQALIEQVTERNTPVEDDDEPEASIRPRSPASRTVSRTERQLLKAMGARAE